MTKLNLSEIRNAFITKKAAIKADTKVNRPQREIDSALKAQINPAIEHAFLESLRDILTGIREGDPMTVEANGAVWQINRTDVARLNRVMQNALFASGLERTESADLENLAVLESALFPESEESTEESNSEESTEEPRQRKRA